MNEELKTQLDRIEAKIDEIVNFINTVAAIAGPMLPGGSLQAAGSGAVKPW